MDTLRPSVYPRRILLAVTGLSPQIVTETLHALAVGKDDPFVPTEIHLITTAEGAERARLALLSDKPGWFHRLRVDFSLPEIAFDVDCIHVLRDASGNIMADIRSPADNLACADFITETVRKLSADPDSALHVSIAGGRKTMGFFLGYALSLFGRGEKKEKAAKAPGEMRTYVVQPGDTLFRVAEKYYGDSTHWKKIRDANRTRIDPDGRIRAGQIIVVP